MKIGDASEIRMGVVLSRKKATTNSNHCKKYKTLTLKSFREEGILELDDLEEFESAEELDDKYLSQEGDVVIRLSYPNTAIYIDSEIVGYVIPSQFSVIRLNTDKILPEFLAIYLNGSKVKKKIAKQQFGATIPVIKNSFLQNLKIKDLALETQRAIVDMYRLHLAEKELLNNLIEEKEKLFNAVFNQLIK